MKKNNFFLIFIFIFLIAAAFISSSKSSDGLKQHTSLLGGKNNAVCERLKKPWPPSNKASLETIYIARDIDFPDVGKLLTHVRVPKSGKGRVVQSASIEQSTCSLIGFSSLKGKKKERLILWRFNHDGNTSGSIVTTQFGHGQDLTRQVNKNGEEWFWVTDDSGKGARRFQVSSKDGKFEIINTQQIILRKDKLKSHNAIVTHDNRHLILLGRNKKIDQGKFMMFIYDLDEIEALFQSGMNGADLVDLSPKFKWPLSDLQHQKKQWRQGIAGLENSIFVLTGDSKAKNTKYLVTYSLSGEELSIQEVRLGRNVAISEGTHYEPEGLEIFFIDGVPNLGIGIASGELGAREYRIWLVPLEATK